MRILLRDSWYEWDYECRIIRPEVDHPKYIVDAVTSSAILKAKQKVGVTFNFDKQDVIDLTKFSKITMCRASEASSER